MRMFAVIGLMALLGYGTGDVRAHDSCPACERLLLDALDSTSSAADALESCTATLRKSSETMKRVTFYDYFVSIGDCLSKSVIDGGSACDVQRCWNAKYPVMYAESVASARAVLGDEWSPPCVGEGDDQ